eukprot:8175177-Ditylum_brightwellii.AAC.1
MREQHQVRPPGSNKRHMNMMYNVVPLLCGMKEQYFDVIASLALCDDELLINLVCDAKTKSWDEGVMKKLKMLIVAAKCSLKNCSSLA